MTQHKTTTARELRPGHVVVAYPDDSHPDRYGQPGEWTITVPDEHIEREIGDRIRVEYDGGMWALHPDQPVQRKPTAQEQVREQQQEQAGVLTDLLLRRELPPATWTISSWLAPMRGHISQGTDADKAAAVNAWANHIGARPEGHPITHEGAPAVLLEVRADRAVMGVELVVWAIVAADSAEEAQS